jgi:hypothetical protein
MRSIFPRARTQLKGVLPATLSYDHGTVEERPGELLLPGHLQEPEHWAATTLYIRGLSDLENHALYSSR